MAEATRVTLEDRHRALVRRFAADLKPTRRLWPVGVRVGAWLALEVAVLAWVVTHTSNRFMEKLTQPIYAIEIVFFVGAATLLALLALRSAIPGRTLRAGEVALAVSLLAAGTVLLMLAEPVSTALGLSEFLRLGLRCAYQTFARAALPWLALWWLVRRGAPMRGGLSGLLVGGGALFFSFAMMRIACPIDESLHLLTWHLLPALALTALSTLAGIAWLDFRPGIRRHDGADGADPDRPHDRAPCTQAAARAVRGVRRM
jgi:hypothetical protein